MFGVVLLANSLGLRVSSGLQLWLSSILIGVIVVAVAVALPSRAGDHWAPFAPHGWLAAGTAASILVWLFVGWEAVAQLAGEFSADPEHAGCPGRWRSPSVSSPSCYSGLAVATIAVTSDTGSRVPLADLGSRSGSAMPDETRQPCWRLR